MSLTEYTILDIAEPTFPQDTHIVTELTPYTTHEYKVRAANIVLGVDEWGAFSVLLDVTTDIARKTLNMENISTVNANFLIYFTSCFLLLIDHDRSLKGF